MIGILTFISPEGVIYITPERMLGGGDQVDTINYTSET